MEKFHYSLSNLFAVRNEDDFYKSNNTYLNQFESKKIQVTKTVKMIKEILQVILQIAPIKDTKQNKSRLEVTHLLLDMRFTEDKNYEQCNLMRFIPMNSACGKQADDQRKQSCPYTLSQA